MGLLDYYRQFDDVDQEEYNRGLRERRAREKALALEQIPVLDLSRNMGLSVVAEGVEDIATWHRLQTLRCAYAQGYFLSRPMPAEDLFAWAAQLPMRGLGADALPSRAAA